MIQLNHYIINSLTISLRPHQQRALDSMVSDDKGQIIVPTGGGKTYIMIQDALNQFSKSIPQTLVVVAPRILLAQQLCRDFMEYCDADVLHVHSGKSEYLNTTKHDEITQWFHNSINNQLIFTTYHSLHKIQECLDVEVDTVYYDESHNSVARSFFESTKYFSGYATRNYFFTATPRISRKHERGMNNVEVYGNTICNVKAQELIESGTILPPTIVPFNTEKPAQDSIIDIIDNAYDDGVLKVLVSVPSSKVLGKMLGQTSLLEELKERDINVLHVTSKFGAYVNDKKVSRHEFLKTLHEWSKDATISFICFHYSILSEGINVSGLTHTIMLRYLSVVEMAQTIGRVIRLDSDDRNRINSGELAPMNWSLYNKPTGYVTVPVHPKTKHIIKRLQKVVDAIFVDGQPPVSLVT